MKRSDRRTGSQEITHAVERQPAGNAAFSDTEDRFQKLFLSTKEAILITDEAATHFLDVNLQACTLVGYSRRELLNLPSTRILARKEEPFTWVRNRGQKAHYTADFRHRSGAIIPCQISAQPIQFGQRPSLMVIAHRASESTTTSVGHVS